MLGPSTAEQEVIQEEVIRWEAGLEALHARIAPRFTRAEPRRRPLAYLKGLLGPAERKNGSHLAEYAGDCSPDGVQRLLSSYDWDANQVRDDLQQYVAEHLGDSSAVLVVDETGFLKQGTKSVGVARQYSGTAGKIGNCQIGVFLAYARPKGCTFLDRELYLSREWTQDLERWRGAGVPEGAGFRTKPELAQVMLGRALVAGIPAGWVTGDAIYGSDRRLRLWLEEQGIAHVLAIWSNEPLWVTTRRGPTQVAAAKLAEGIPPDEWRRLSAGNGAKGPRWYEWARVAIRPLGEAGKGYWLLARRSLSDPGELACYVCFGPEDTSLADLVGVAGMRWTI